MKEEYLLTTELAPTNEGFAIVKIAGIKMCLTYKKQCGFNSISLMPTDLYEPGDNFNLESSHVMPALGKENKVLYDIKYILPVKDVDGRL